MTQPPISEPRQVCRVCDSPNRRSCALYAYRRELLASRAPPSAIPAICLFAHLRCGVTYLYGLSLIEMDKVDSIHLVGYRVRGNRF